MKSPIELRADPRNDKEVSLTFKRDGFSEFLGSLLQTPREEQKRIELGFDVAPSDMRILFEKLNQHVSTQNDVLNREFSAQILFEDESEFGVGSMEEFAEIDYGSRPAPEKFNLTVTYLIGFQRENDQKVYERQVVQIIVSRGTPGVFELRLRSTEITWPPAIMSLLEKEIRALSSRTSVSKTMGNKALFFFAPWFRKDRSRQDAKGDFSGKSKRLRFFDIVVFVMFPIMLLTVFLDAKQKADVFVFDPMTRTVSLQDFSTLVESEGWERAAQLSIYSKEMLVSGYAEYAASEGPISRLFVHLRDLLDVYSLIVALGVGAYLIASARQAAALDRAEAGRLFLDRSEIGPRPEVPIWTGWLAGICGAVFANLLTNAINALL